MKIFALCWAQPYYPKFSSIMLGKSLLYAEKNLVYHQSFTSYVYSGCKLVAFVIFLERYTTIAHLAEFEFSAKYDQPFLMSEGCQPANGPRVGVKVSW